MSGLSTRYDYARPLTPAARAQHQADRQVKRFFKKIAEAEKIDRSFVSRLLRLTLLAPDIQETILEGRQAKGMQLEELTRAMPGTWGEQRGIVA
jgi:ribosome-binding protein aMBF1 (putative translation factor)